MPRKSITLDEWKRICTEINDGIYDYSNVTSIDKYDSKVEIICPIHGAFIQSASVHKRGSGCKACYLERSHILPRELVVERLSKIHGDMVIFDDFIYSGMQVKSNFICRKHGPFESTPNNLLRRSCTKCALEKRSTGRTDSQETFESKVVATHGKGTYDLSKSVYTSSQDRITVTCKEHGDFTILPYNFVRGNGCPLCTRFRSSGELEVMEYLKSIGVSVEASVRGLFADKRYEVDIWIPSHNLAIEFDGTYWHSSKCKERFNVLDKSKMAWAKGIDLVHIREDLWKSKKAIYKNILKNRVDANSNKVWARQCEIKDMCTPDFRLFCEENHLQGYRGGAIMKGLYYDGLLVCAANVSSKTGELVRYVVRGDWNVGAGLKRLIAHMPVKFSFCDLSHFNGNGYRKSGFTEEYRTSPNYCYTKNGVCVSRQRRMKHKLPTVFGNCDMDLTEEEINAVNGWHRLYDCGNIKFNI